MRIADVNAQTGIPIKELNHLNRDFWYHGTSVDGAEDIQKLGVIALYNRGNMLDFGAGFYLTDTRERADSYMSRVPVVGPGYRTMKRTEWAVMEFKFNPFMLLFGNPDETNEQEMTVLRGLNYTYRNFAKHNEEFAKFVFDNRLNNVNNENPHGFEIIWGVMSDNFPDQIMYDFSNGRLTYEDAIEKLQKPNSMKQLYIGSQRICDMLILSNVFRGSQSE